MNTIKLRTGLKGQFGGVLPIAAFVLMMALILFMLPPLYLSNQFIAEMNDAIALDYAESQAQSVASDVRIELDKVFYNKIDKAFSDHLKLDSKARSSRPGSPQAIYQCGDLVVDTSTTPLSEIRSLCDPNSIVDPTTVFIAKTHQTNDLFSKMMPASPPANADALYLSAYNEIKREMYNDFDYSVKIQYIGSRVVKQGIPRRARVAPQPRIEQYRWAAKADIYSRTYNNVYLPYTARFDIVATVSIYDETMDCGNPPIGAHPIGFASFLSREVLRCTDASKSPYDADCPKVVTGMNTLDPYDEYKKNCYDANKQDTCLEKAKLDCPDETIAAGLCSVAPGVVFKANTSNKGTFVATGCKTATGGARATGGYSFDIAYKIVRNGNNHN